MKNREIDQLNLKIQSANETLKKIERLLMSPYFGKIEIDFLEEEAQVTKLFILVRLTLLMMRMKPWFMIGVHRLLLFSITMI